MISETESALQVRRADDHWIIRFSAMASPCDILVHCDSSREAISLADVALTETMRIERKFSRYRTDNIIHRINNGGGRTIAVDSETASLLRYAGSCHSLSGGSFDITSGVLRRAWRFDGKEFVPDSELIESLLALVGWDKVALTPEGIQLRAGMEIDLGGIGKEYAVDRVTQMLSEFFPYPMMVNFGGDIRTVVPAASPFRWHVGIEDPEQSGRSMGVVELSNGAVATSGDAYRYCIVNGHRFGHILDPRTGRPVENAPRSVTVLADFCTEAGLLCTMAMLKGSEAEEFLSQQGVRHFCCR